MSTMLAAERKVAIRIGSSFCSVAVGTMPAGAWHKGKFCARSFAREIVENAWESLVEAAAALRRAAARCSDRDNLRGDKMPTHR
jgi:hypothetical protein